MTAPAIATRAARGPVRLVVTLPGAAVATRFDADPLPMFGPDIGRAERFEAACRRRGIRWVTGLLWDADGPIRVALDTHADIVIDAAT